MFSRQNRFCARKFRYLQAGQSTIHSFQAGRKGRGNDLKRDRGSLSLRRRDEIVPSSFNFSHSSASPFAILRSALSLFSSASSLQRPLCFKPPPSVVHQSARPSPRHALTQKAGNSCSIHRLSPPRIRLFPLVFSLGTYIHSRP